MWSSLHFMPSSSSSTLRSAYLSGTVQVSLFNSKRQDLKYSLKTNITTVQHNFFSAVTLNILLLSYLAEDDSIILSKVLFVSNNFRKQKQWTRSDNCLLKIIVDGIRFSIAVGNCGCFEVVPDSPLYWDNQSQLDDTRCGQPCGSLCCSYSRYQLWRGTLLEWWCDLFIVWELDFR